MKTIYLVGGTMGVGKTSACLALQGLLPRSVFLDGDWCWYAPPFPVTAETKAMVLDNITHLLNSFLRCSAYDHVIFCWVMHRQEIIDELLSRLDTDGCRVLSVSLVCSEAALRARLEGDIARGLRMPEVLPRSLERLPLYRTLHTALLDTTDKTPRAAAEALAAL